MTDQLPEVQLTPEQEARAQVIVGDGFDMFESELRAARLIVHLQDRVKELEEKLEELHDAHDTLEAKHDKCGAVPEVTGADLVTDFDRGYAEGYSDAGASTPPSCWQPIETAPRDIEVLCYWSPMVPAGPNAIGTAVHSSIGDGWQRLNNPFTSLRTPSYWSPLPTPPETTEGGRNAG